MLIIGKLLLGADILDNLNFTIHYGNLKAKSTNSKLLVLELMGR